MERTIWKPMLASSDSSERARNFATTYALEAREFFLENCRRFGEAFSISPALTDELLGTLLRLFDCCFFQRLHAISDIAEDADGGRSHFDDQSRSGNAFPGHHLPGGFFPVRFKDMAADQMRADTASLEVAETRATSTVSADAIGVATTVRYLWFGGRNSFGVTLTDSVGA